MQNVKKGFFIFWQIPITLGTIENLNLFGIFCVSISLQNAEALAETGGFPSNFRFYTRMFAQWRSRPLFQCRYKITETHVQALFLFPLVSREHRSPPPPLPNRGSLFAQASVYLLVFKR